MRNATMRSLLLFTVMLAVPALAESRGRVPDDDDLAPAVYFDRNSVAITPEVLPYLEQWAAYLTRRDLDSQVRLLGHASARGDPSHNQWLAEQRALAVRRALVAMGVDRRRLEVESAGAARPQAFGHNDFAWTRNRRVELRLQP